MYVQEKLARSVATSGWFQARDNTKGEVRPNSLLVYFLARIVITKHQLYPFSRSQKLIEDPFLLSSLGAWLSLPLPFYFSDSQQHVQLYFMCLNFPKVSSSVRSPLSHTVCTCWCLFCAEYAPCQLQLWNLNIVALRVPPLPGIQNNKCQRRSHVFSFA